MVIDVSNIAVLLKFSVIFQVTELLNHCAVWMEGNGLNKESEKILNEANTIPSLQFIDSIDFKVCRSLVSPGYVTIGKYSNGSKDLASLDEHNCTENGISTVAVSNMSYDFNSLNIKNPKSASKDIGNGTPPGFENPIISKKEQVRPGEKLRVRQTVSVQSYNRDVLAPSLNSQLSSYKMDISEWKSFSEEDMERLCSPFCRYPEFVKIEIAIAWLKNHIDQSFNECQDLFYRLLETMDPLLLSDRYISFINSFLESMKPRPRFPPHFLPHRQHSCYLPDNTESNSKYVMHVWTLKKQDLQEIEETHCLSFFGECNLCNKGTQEVVLKLERKTPCYTTKTEQHRRKIRKYGVTYPVHFHNKTVKHWVIKTGSYKNQKLHSLVTCDYNEIVDLFSQYSNLKVACLQLKS